MISFVIISEEKDILGLGTNTHDELQKWIEVFHHAFKDITEEHRSAVRSLDSQQKFDRSSLSTDNLLNFGRNTIGKGKLPKSGLSSVAMRSSHQQESNGCNYR